MTGRFGQDTFLGRVAAMTLTAVITTVFIVFGLVALLGNTGADSLAVEKSINTNQEAIIKLQAAAIDSQNSARDANLAIACELALPVDPETGRNQADVRFCFTQYGFEPPLLAEPDK